MDEPVLILRDPRESIRKCSLTPLRGVSGFRFLEYHASRRVEAAGRILLHPDGELIGPEDAGAPLLLVDCSWRRLPSLLRTIDGEPRRRPLPPLVTAYPRKSRDDVDPSAGLASIEALYAALALLGQRREELLDGYRWREPFLEANAALL